MRNVHIVDSYKIWSVSKMRELIIEGCGGHDPEMWLNRSMKGMYIEWYLHNIGYFITLPFTEYNRILGLNLRFRDVDLEEHR